MSRRHCLVPVFHGIWLFHSFCPLFNNGPWVSGRVCYMCSICGWVLHWHLFYTLEPAISVCVNHCLLYKETSLRSERFTNLWGEKAINVNGSLILHLFSRTIVVVHPLVPLRSPIMDSWLDLYSTRHVFPAEEWALSLILKSSWLFPQYSCHYCTHRYISKGQSLL